ncbi:hypothetical protein Bbelb_118230 [Branchiostoma belcheri]|nr:hypothetical protein Bbelb_443260 [Branchiostoma belcheri]KAI8510907.1 hypothetical protein Bbelb_118230 [Branchiostoma belcheri]
MTLWAIPAGTHNTWQVQPCRAGYSRFLESRGRRCAFALLPKKILYGELSQGSRQRGRPKLRFKDMCKATLQDFSIESWEKVASDRSKWRAAIHKGTELFKAARETRQADARSRRKGLVAEKSATQEYCCRFCGRACRARIGCTSHERRCPARPPEND